MLNIEILQTTPEMTHFSPFSKSPIESQAYLVLANELSEVG